MSLPTHRFAAAIAAERTADGFSAEVAEGWDVAGNTNGGYLMALAAGMMRTHCARQDPVTLTGHFLRPVKPGPVQSHCETVKEGSAFATVRCTLKRDKPLVTLLGAFGSLASSKVAALKVDGAPPELPPVADCQTQGDNEFAPALFQQVDLRLHPEDAGFAFGKPSGQAMMRGWFRLKNDEPLSTLALLLALDAFPPTVFNAKLPVAWTPTVELTAHLRARPAPGWLKARFTTRFVTGGFLEEDGELWDSTDQLVAQSRQLALVPKAS